VTTDRDDDGYNDRANANNDGDGDGGNKHDEGANDGAGRPRRRPG
jgi:hypothetical protein